MARSRRPPRRIKSQRSPAPVTTNIAGLFRYFHRRALDDGQGNPPSWIRSSCSTLYQAPCPQLPCVGHRLLYSLERNHGSQVPLHAAEIQPGCRALITKPGPSSDFCDLTAFNKLSKELNAFGSGTRRSEPGVFQVLKPFGSVTKSGFWTCSAHVTPVCVCCHRLSFFFEFISRA